MWLPFWKAVSQISIWLVKKAFTINYSLICLVRQKCGWKGNCLDRRVKTLKCGWHPPDAGELALLLYINVTMSTPENVEISLLLEIYKQKEDPWNFHKYFFFDHFWRLRSFFNRPYSWILQIMPALPSPRKSHILNPPMAFSAIIIKSSMYSYTTLYTIY